MTEIFFLPSKKQMNDDIALVREALSQQVAEEVQNLLGCWSKSNLGSEAFERIIQALEEMQRNNPQDQLTEKGKGAIQAVKGPKPKGPSNGT